MGECGIGSAKEALCEIRHVETSEKKAGSEQRRHGDWLTHRRTSRDRVALPLLARLDRHERWHMNCVFEEPNQVKMGKSREMW